MPLFIYRRWKDRDVKDYMLSKENIIRNEQNIEEGIFSLNLINPEIYVKGIKIATIEKINIFTLIFNICLNSTDPYAVRLGIFHKYQVDSVFSWKKI